jgi:hypothetical protein
MIKGLLKGIAFTAGYIIVGGVGIAILAELATNEGGEEI